MTTIKYKFDTQQDLMFYILNAAGHDFIHDFNNYGRMGKILQYIMGLVENTVSTATAAEINREMQPVVAELNRQQSIQEELDRSNTNARTAVGIEYDTAPINSDAIVPDTPSTIYSFAPGNPPDEIKIVQANQDSAVDNPLDNSTETLSTAQLYESQKEDNFISEPIQSVTISDISSDTPVQAIVNKNIELYNYIAVTIPTTTEKETRSTTKKLNVMQRLKDFIQESKFLIISKLSSGVNRLRSGRSYGGKGIKKQSGGNGVNIITRDDIIRSIKDIIEEINETAPQNLQLISFFEYIMHSYLYLSIPNISPIEIFNNSLIEDSTCIFIIGQCNNTNIREQARLSLMSLLHISDTAKGLPREEIQTSLDKTKSPVDLSKFMARGVLQPTRGITNSFTRPTRQIGGAFNSTIYSTINKDALKAFEDLVSEFGDSLLFTAYYSTRPLPQPNDQQYSSLCVQIYSEYKNFVTRSPKVQQPNKKGQLIDVSIIELIAGPQMYSAKTVIIENKRLNANKGGRNEAKNNQEMIDTINDLIFIKTIDTYNDVKNRLQARNEDTGDGSSISGSAKTAVQKVSQLLAYKILQLTGVPITPTSLPPATGNSDLDKQIKILYDVAVRDRGYTSADDALIKYFIDTYGDQGNVLSGQDSLFQLQKRIGSCSKKMCRVINNAVPADVKSAISNIVVCPTSSVCDGMGSFGSCVNPSGNKEYANMNFLVSYGNEKYSYYGQTNIKPDLTSVNINYGIVYNNLQIYNFIDIKIDSQPIVLQANYVFKNLINRIIEIWKTAPGANIDELWSHLYNTDYFLSILKLGSQKAVGDIFQEINSTLENGGYNVPVQGVIDKNTYGLMGDRPSGVRVLKLLNSRSIGKNPKASGGYVGGETSLIYFSQAVRGGNKMTKKRKHKVTSKYYRRKRQTKRRNKHNKTK